MVTFIKKINSCFSFILGFIMACSSEMEEMEEMEKEVNTATYDISPILDKFEGTGLSYEIAGDFVILLLRTYLTIQVLTGLPAMHYIANTPAVTLVTVKSQYNCCAKYCFYHPLYPSEATVKEATPLGAIGISRNGVVFTINTPDLTSH